MASKNTAGSSIGSSNTASAGASTIASSGSTTSNTATSNTATSTASSNTASSSIGSLGNVFRGSGAGLGSTIQTTKTPPIGSLGSIDEDFKGTDIFDSVNTLDKLQDQYAVILEQKMMAQVLQALVGRESKEFKDWADSKGIEITQHESITDFISNMEAGQFTSDDKLNGKIERVLKYIPDIVGSLAKSEAIAPGAKVIGGENPIVDEIKFGIEKVIAPTLKKVGTLLEKRLGSEVGKKIGKQLVVWAEKLKTLPSKTLEAIGPADIILSVVDASLLAIDQATGNYRQQNHDVPSEVLGIPIIGQYIDILGSARDLLDSAGGIPRDDEAIPILQKRLEDNLWKPSIEQYGTIMKELGSHEQAFQELSKVVDKQVSRSVIYKELLPRLNTIAEEFGNNQADMKAYIRKEFGIDFNPSIKPNDFYVKNLTTISTNLSKQEKALLNVENDIIGMPEGRMKNIRINQQKDLKAKVADLRKQKTTLEKDVTRSKENDTQRFLINDIDKMIQYQLGRVSKADLDKGFVDDKVSIPEIKQTVNGGEVIARVALDNVYSAQDLIRKASNTIKTLDREINDFDNQINKILSGRTSIFGRQAVTRALRPSEKAKISELNGKMAKVRIEKMQLETKTIPTITSQLEDMYGEFEDALDNAREMGVDTQFLEKSKNWDKALSDIEDDTMFWEEILPGGLFF